MEHNSSAVIAHPRQPGEYENSNPRLSNSAANGFQSDFSYLTSHKNTHISRPKVIIQIMQLHSLEHDSDVWEFRKLLGHPQTRGV